MARIDFTQPQILWNEICLLRLLSFRGFSFVFTPVGSPIPKTESSTKAGSIQARESELDMWVSEWVYVYILRHIMLVSFWLAPHRTRDEERSFERISRLAFCLNSFSAVAVDFEKYKILEGFQHFPSDNVAERADFISTILLKFIRLRMLINPLSSSDTYPSPSGGAENPIPCVTSGGLLDRTACDRQILPVLLPC